MRWLLIALLVAVHGAWAQSVSGKVVSIADGDTLTILDAAKRQHKIRLPEIDAPEKGQPFGNASRESLASMPDRPRHGVALQGLRTRSAPRGRSGVCWSRDRSQGCSQRVVGRSWANSAVGVAGRGHDDN